MEMPENWGQAPSYRTRRIEASQAEERNGPEWQPCNTFRLPVSFFDSREIRNGFFPGEAVPLILTAAGNASTPLTAQVTE